MKTESQCNMDSHKNQSWKFSVCSLWPYGRKKNTFHSCILSNMTGVGQKNSAVCWPSTQTCNNIYCITFSFIYLIYYKRPANALASSVGTALRWRRSLLLPTNIITMLLSAWSWSSLSQRSAFSYVRCLAMS